MFILKIHSGDKGLIVVRWSFDLIINNDLNHIYYSPLFIKFLNSGNIMIQLFRRNLVRLHVSCPGI